MKYRITYRQMPEYIMTTTYPGELSIEDANNVARILSAAGLHSVTISPVEVKEYYGVGKRKDGVEVRMGPFATGENARDMINAAYVNGLMTETKVVEEVKKG